MSVGPMMSLAAMLLLSGVAGLSYEVVWLRLAAHAVGSNATAMALTLAAFMGGMALGARAIGPSVDRARQPLRWFAACEVGLAGFAFLVPMLLGLLADVDRVLGPILPGRSASWAVGTLTVFVFLLPTSLMGATLPAIAAHLARWRLVRGFVALYAVHVFGAVLGCLAASLAAIPAFGLHRTSYLGAVFNLTAAGIAWLVANRKAAIEPESARMTAESAVPGSTLAASAPSLRGSLSPGTCAALAFASGFLLLGSEVVFVRTLVMSLSAKVHSFAIMLATFLAGLSLASAVSTLVPARWGPRGWIAGILGVTALALLLARENVLRGVPVSLEQFMSDGEVSRGEYLLLLLRTCGLSLLPVALSAGMILPLLLRVATNTRAAAGTNVGRILFWNTAGSVSGPLVLTWLLVPLFGLLGSLYLAAWGAVALALWVLVRRSSDWRVIVFGTVGTAAVVVCLVRVEPHLGGTPSLDSTLAVERKLLGAAPPEILHHREGSTATVTVTTRDGRPTLRLDGFEAAGVPGERTQAYQYMRLLAHLPVLLRPANELELGLVICCGTGTTAGSLCAHPLERVDLVDLHPEVLDCLGYFREANRDLENDRRCRKVATDGRVHLRRTSARYDVITLEPMPPQYAGMTQLYSVEFYRDCERVMKDGAVLAQWLPYHLVTAEQARAMVAAVVEVFGEVQVWEHRKTGILVACKGSELVVDEGRFQEARQAPTIRADFDAMGFVDFEAFLDAYVCDAESLELGDVAPIRDDRPDLEYRVFGFGLQASGQEELARIREPFFRARLECEPPMRGVEPERARALIVRWRATSFARYASFLRAREGRREAHDFLERAVQANAELASAPMIRSLLTRWRAESRHRASRVR